MTALLTLCTALSAENRERSTCKDTLNTVLECELRLLKWELEKELMLNQGGVRVRRPLPIVEKMVTTLSLARSLFRNKVDDLILRRSSRSWKRGQKRKRSLLYTSSNGADTGNHSNVSPIFASPLECGQAYEFWSSGENLVQERHVSQRSMQDQGISLSGYHSATRYAGLTDTSKSELSSSTTSEEEQDGRTFLGCLISMNRELKLKGEQYPGTQKKSG